MQQTKENLCFPDYGSDSILGLSNGILKQFGIQPHHPPLILEECAKEIPVRAKTKVVVIVLDALGWNSFQKCLQDTEFAALTAAFKKIKLSSTFPTTTTAALTTLYTASTPIEHGMLGYILFLKKFFSLVNMIDITPVGMERDLLTQHGFNPFKWLPVKTIFEKLMKRGVKSFSITSNLFKNTALSKMHHAGSSMKGYTDMVDMLFLLKKALEEESPLFVFAYWGLSDSFGHHFGPSSEEYQLEVKNFFYLFSQIFLKNTGVFPDRKHTLFLITADHGQIDTDWFDEEWIASDHRFIKDYFTLPPFGEPRALYFIPKEEKAFLQYFEEHYLERFFLLSREQALKEGLFGSNTHLTSIEENLSRIGEWVAISKGKSSIHYRYTGNEKSFKGKHGSITEDELYVPLLIAE